MNEDIKRLVKLTENQREVLNSLEWANHQSRHPQSWCTPLDIGASNGSHHSGTLAALAKKGLVQFKQRGVSEDLIGMGPRHRVSCGNRGSKCYRITETGRQALASLTTKETDHG